MAASPILLAMSNVPRNGLQAFFQPKPQLPQYHDSPIQEQDTASTILVQQSRAKEEEGVDTQAKPRSGNASVGTTVWPISSTKARNGTKRRKLDHVNDDQGVVEQKIIPLPTQPNPQADLSMSVSALIPVGTPHNSNDPPQSSPKKVLKLNALGGLGPPPQASEMQVEQTGPRKRRSAIKAKVASRIVRLLYPAADRAAFASKLQQIWSGTLRHVTVAPVIRRPDARPAASSGAPQSTHPFFSGASKPRKRVEKAQSEIAAPSQPEPRSPHITTAATPGKIRREVAAMKAREHELEDTNINPPTSGAQKGIVWPPSGMLHIRGSMHKVAGAAQPRVTTRRKNKTVDTRTFSSSDLLNNYRPSYLNELSISARERADGFMDPHPSLRLPQRRLMTGQQILDHVQSQLCSQDRDHPAIKALLNSIASHMTAADNGLGEPRSWLHKYAPSSAAAVLQTGNEAAYLRDWMKTLSVATVNKGDIVKRPFPGPKPKKKRRKKTDDDMDDFIVSSGDEIDQLGSLSDFDEGASQSSRGGPGGRSIARSILDASSRESRKAVNTLVLSGPHGSGKTAMVYAAAKELNFQVFEINASSRRSGKDIWERIGDVLGNHIVGRDRVDAGSLSADEDAARVSDALQKDLESGRQGTMGAFFKSKPVIKAIEPVGAAKKKTPAVTSKTKPDSAHGQKQSLILLEEVDVLFEEDRNFWTTVESLMATSKRPIIMTCTDESLIPLEENELQAVLRLSAPEPDLAVDYLTLMAAQEGHLIGREAVATLYRLKGDLRASILELQFWLQMGVGCPRGGLEWLFQRWPQGVGVDQHGHTIRVTSHGTYHKGMGMLPYERSDTARDWRTENVTAAWSDWQVDPRDETFDHVANTNGAVMSSLKQMQAMSDALSAMDVYCRVDLPIVQCTSPYGPLGSSLRQTQLDATKPELSVKSRLSYVEGVTLLEADERLDYSYVDRQMVVTVCELLQNRNTTSMPQKSPPDLTHQLRQRIMSATSSPAVACPLPAASIYAALDPLSDPAPPSSSTSALFSSHPPTSSPSTSAGGVAGGTYTSLLSPLPALTVDIAPYVRSIAAFDLALEADRARLHEALHGHGSGSASAEGKVRRTRAARGALEGKGRSGVRRERWWEGVALDASKLAGTGPVGAVAAARRVAVAVAASEAAAAAAAAALTVPSVEVEEAGGGGGGGGAAELTVEMEG